MKKITNILYFLLFLIFFAISSKAQSQNIVLRGRANSSLHYLLVTKIGANGISIVTDTIQLKQKNTFNYHFEIKKPAMIYLGYGNKNTIRLWLGPGDILTMNLQNKIPEFKGDGARFAQYFLGDGVFFTKTYGYYLKRNPNFDNSNNRYTDKYFTIQDSVTFQRINFLKDYFAGITNPFKQEFINQQSLSLIYSNLNYKLLYEGANIEKFKFYQAKYKIKRSDSYKYSDEPVFNNPELLSNSFYCEFACQFIVEMTRKRMRESGKKWNFNAYADSAMLVIDELTAGSGIGLVLKAIFLNEIVEEIGAERKLDYVDKVYAVILTLNQKNDLRLKLVKDKLDKIIADTQFEKGKQAPNFTFKDSSGRLFTLKDFIGKKVYMDIVASWCGHCIEKIPMWNKLVKENEKNEKVIFISLSLDDKEGEWKTFLQNHTVKGMRLFAGEGGWKSDFANNYKISFLPHFILLDEEGKIIQYSAPQPDDEAVLKYLQIK